jgi:hypothetical protein
MHPFTDCRGRVVNNHALWSGGPELKAKAVPLHAMKALGERRYSSYSFPTSTLDRGEWSASRPGRALAPEKGPPVRIVQEAGWAPEPVWTTTLSMFHTQSPLEFNLFRSTTGYSMLNH